MPPRTLLLFSPDTTPQGWNERMLPHEYAVLYSSQVSSQTSFQAAARQQAAGGPHCTVFPSLAEAHDHARAQVALNPALRCRIYSNDGLGRPPVEELRGTAFRGDSEISARFRRWAGSLLFLTGAALIAFDWAHNFELSWPATLGARALPVGLILLVTEAAILWTESRKEARRRQAQSETAHS